MKLAVFSDAHNNIKAMEKTVQDLEEVDYLIYAGDGLERVLNSVIISESECDLLAVQGNCDHVADYPRERTIDFGGVRIFLAHGKRYRIKWGLDNLYYKAREVKADIVIFGHTHRRLAQQQDDILFFNPGSISRPRDNKAPSYGLLEIKGDDIDYKHVDCFNNEN
ncbi:metallophosphoesterase family protein [Halanaerobacter jeridensis]|uniref:Phosphoesterase n=1 Tax=Halanaerobacter jeridensis TaxID=706427 RepID=A0A938XSQ2_9FIRM|nr:metallophosphoesterase [Halanaerobacter jeridensis]MBM7556144.1 putative phosphoesterase [Halanaerobacter jeridensis]